jgi:small subunit ribosomal protein S1
LSTGAAGNGDEDAPQVRADSDAEIPSGAGVDSTEAEVTDTVPELGSDGAEVKSTGGEVKSAGASTGAPDAVEEPKPEVLEDEPESPASSDPEFAELLERSLDRARPIGVGDRLRAVVQRIEDEVSFLDYGGPSEAVIDTRELRDPDGNLKFGVGERIDVTVAAAGDQVKVHRIVRKSRDRSVLKQAFANKTPVEGKVTGTNKGGFDVQVAGFRAFCPISQIDRVYCSEPQAYVGQVLPFRIIEFKEGGRRVVVSRRALLDEERRSEAEQTRARLQVGDEIEGTVVRLQPFGAFVDIGGLDGLVHVSELRHGRVSDPAEAVRVGQKLAVKVIGIENLGAEKGERISLSARALESDPWSKVTDQLQVGTVAQGRVVRLMNYGAFVEMMPGVEGLLHLSEMGEKRPRHPGEVVAEGATIEVRVIELDADRRRLSLSMRSEDSPRAAETPRKLEPGMSIEGSVSSVKPYGAFVRINEPVSGVDGLLPVEETQVARGEDLAQTFPVGSAVRAEVLRVDSRGRIRLTQRPAHERQASPGRETGADGEAIPDRRPRDREPRRDRPGGREMGGRDRGGRRERDSGERERREPRRDRPESHRDSGTKRGADRDLSSSQGADGEETGERRTPKQSPSSGLGIMAKAFKRVLDGR